MERLQDSFNAEISADTKTEVLELEPDEEQPGHCVASFIPDVETTYKFRVFGNLSGNPSALNFYLALEPFLKIQLQAIRQKRSLTPVIRNEVIGGYECPSPKSNGTFPEVVLSNVEMSKKVSELGHRISSLQNATKSSKINQ
jgi:hypothetical protein